MLNIRRVKNLGTNFIKALITINLLIQLKQKLNLSVEAFLFVILAVIVLVLMQLYLDKLFK